MAPVIPVIAAIAAEAAVSALAITGFAATVVGSIIAGGINMAGSALFSKKAKGRSFGGDNLGLVEDKGFKQTEVSTLKYREIVYGKVRKPGGLIYRGNTSAGKDNKGETVTGINKVRHMIIAYASHEITSYEKHYLNDVPLNLDANGWVLNPEYCKNSDTATTKGTTSFNSDMYAATNATGSGTSIIIYINTTYAISQTKIKPGSLAKLAGYADSSYNGQFEVVSIASHASGNATQVNLVSDNPVSTSPISQVGCTFQISPMGYRGLVAYVYDNTDHGLTNSDKVYINGGSPDLYNTAAAVITTKNTQTFVYTLASIPSNVSSSGTFQRRNGTDECLIRIKEFLGGEDQNVASELQSLVPDKLNVSTDKMRGIACVYYQMFFNRDVFDAIPQPTVLIKGKKLYDPRVRVTRYTNNLALVALDYMTGKIGARAAAYGMGLPLDKVNNTSTRIDLDYFKSAADICDEDIELKAGGSLPRYTVDGTVSCGEAKSDNLNKILLHGSAILTRVKGKYRLHVGTYDLPTHHINEDWLTGDITAKVGSGIRDLMNTATGIFVDPAKNYYNTDFPPLDDEEAIEEDGEEFNKDLQLPFVSNVENAQRLAKLYKNMKRRVRTIQLPVNYRALNVTIWDTVFLSLDKFEFKNKVFRVTGYSAGLAKDAVVLNLREEDPEIYEWDKSEVKTLD